MGTHCVTPCRWQPVTAEIDGRAVVDGALACEVIEGALVVWAPTTERPLKRYKAKRRQWILIIDRNACASRRSMAMRTYLQAFEIVRYKHRRNKG